MFHKLSNAYKGTITSINIVLILVFIVFFTPFTAWILHCITVIGIVIDSDQLLTHIHCKLQTVKGVKIIMKTEMRT